MLVMHVYRQGTSTKDVLVCNPNGADKVPPTRDQ